MEDIIDIIVTETTNTIEITAQPNDEIIDVNIIDNREDIVLNVTPTVVEININSLTGNFGVNWGDIDGTLSNQTDLQNALNLKADLVDGKVPSSQLPSYVDDIVEVATYSALPTTGETGKIYVVLNTNLIYRWSGSAYIEIKDSSAVWGAITGTLSSQTDLQNALNAKFNNPTGDSTQYLNGAGTPVTFPVAGQSGTLVREVRNTTGATLTKGTIVYISGATGNKPTVSKAIATGDSTSAQTFGMCQADISNNSNGYVVCVGDITGLDTSALSEGVQLYLSSTTAGTYTTTKQVAPAHLVYIGVVTRSHPTQGQIEVKIQNGYELDEIHDVLITSKANNDGLFYESSTSLWKNKSIATVLGYTPQAQLNGTGFVKASGTTISYDSSTYLTTSVASSTYVPYTGASSNVNLGTRSIEASSFIRRFGTNSEFLKADGSVDSTSYQPILTNPVTGTGTSGIVAKFNGTSTITDSIIYDNGTRVSIGADVTTSNKFTAVASTTSSYAVVAQASGSANGFWATLSGSGEIFRGQTSGGSYFIINNGGNAFLNGNLNVGDFASTSYKLNVVGTANFTGALSGTSASFSSSVTATQAFLSGTSSITSNDQGVVRFKMVNTGGATASGYALVAGVANESQDGFSIYDYTNSKTRITLTSAGNVGIGTTSPTDYSGYTTLHLNGKSGANGGVLRLSAYDSTSSANIYAGGSALNINTTTAVPIKFLTRDTVRMQILDSGAIIGGHQLGNQYSMTSGGGTGTAIVDTGITYNSGDYGGYGRGVTYQVVFNGNPNGNGSAAYFAQYMGIIIIYTGWSGSAVTTYIQYTQLAGGSNIGALTLTPVFWNGSTESSSIGVYTTGAQIRLKISGYNSAVTGQDQSVYLTRIS